jgi:hypothetical protein
MPACTGCRIVEWSLRSAPDDQPQLTVGDLNIAGARLNPRGVGRGWLPGKYAGQDNGWTLALVYPVVIEFDKSSHWLLKFEHELVDRFAARRLDRKVARILGVAPEIAFGDELESDRFDFATQADQFD